MDAIEQIMLDRFDHMQCMHKMMRCMNNEEAYMTWINTVPDEPSDDDLRDIAEDDDMFQEVCNLYRHLLKVYGDDGFFIGHRAW